MDVAISGASGFIGSALSPALVEAGHRPVALVRRPARGEDEIQWDIDKGEVDSESLEGMDAVVHLAGAGIAGRRWNEAYKQTLLESRTRGTSLLASTLAGLNTPPKVMLSGSAIGYYGDRGDEELTEGSAAGEGFLADLVTQWEASAQSAIDAGIRTAFLRTGLVYSPAGGSLPKLLPLFKIGLGGRFGSGRQWQSWISLDDEVGAILHLLQSSLSGPVNLTAPNPVTNAELTEVLGRVLGRPTFATVPALGPRLLMGREMANALLFDSARVHPTQLLSDGYDFAHPNLEGALRHLLGRQEG